MEIISQFLKHYKIILYIFQVTNVSQSHGNEAFGELKGTNTAAYQAHAHAQQLLGTHGDIPLLHDYHSL